MTVPCDSQSTESDENYLSSDDVNYTDCDDADGVDPSNLGAVHCAVEVHDGDESEFCDGPGIVYYGHGTHWVTIELGDGESIVCSNDAIGCDPIGGEEKNCYILNVTSSVFMQMKS